MTVQAILVLRGQNTICSKRVVKFGMSFPVKCMTTSCPCMHTVYAIAAKLAPLCSTGSAHYLGKNFLSSVYSDRVTVV